MTPSEEPQSIEISLERIGKSIPDLKHEQLEMEARKINLVELSTEWLYVAQLNDIRIQETVQLLESGKLSSRLVGTYVLKRFENYTYILCRIIQFKKKDHTVPILRSAYKYLMVNKIHEAISHLVIQ